MEIKELTFLTYFLTFNDSMRNSLSDYYMYQVKLGVSSAVMLVDGDDVLSYAIILRKGEFAFLSYIFTEQTKRNKGYATKLLQLINTNEKHLIRTYIISNHPCYNAMKHIMEKLGYQNTCLNHVYSLDFDSDFEKTFNSLNPSRLCEFISRNNYECLPLSKMTPNLEKQLLSTKTSEFRDEFSVQSNYREVFNPDLSMIAVKDGILKAYAFTSQLSGDTISIDVVSEALSERGSGIVFLILAKGYEIIKKENKIKKAFFKISDNNHPSLSLVKSIVSTQNVKAYENIYFF